MPKVALYNMTGNQIGEIELNDSVFGAPVNKLALHEVVRATLANRRQGTQSTLTRAEVRGGGVKPWKQKGTGRARQGSTRSPQWRKGGVVFAPKPRDYSISVNKKVKRIAMLSALSGKVELNQMVVVDKLALEQAKTKEMVKVLNNLKAQKALIVLEGANESVQRASGNIEGVKSIPVNNISVYDLLKYEKLVITEQAVKMIEEVYAV